MLLPALSEEVSVIDPWALTSAEEFAAATADAAAIGRFAVAVGRRNAAAIRECDVLVACLDGQEVDSGTAAEVGYASALGVRCHGLRTDLRRAGERGAVVNLQVQAFIEMSGGRIARSLDELLGDLRRAAAA